MSADDHPWLTHDVFSEWREQHREERLTSHGRG